MNLPFPPARRLQWGSYQIPPGKLIRGIKIYQPKSAQMYYIHPDAPINPILIYFPELQKQDLCISIGVNMRNKSIEKMTVIKELENMEKQLDDGANMVWTNFPYSSSNLAVIRSSLKELGLCHDNFRISFDENDIFIEKDNFFVQKEDIKTFNKNTESPCY